MNEGDICPHADENIRGHPRMRSASTGCIPLSTVLTAIASEVLHCVGPQCEVVNGATENARLKNAGTNLQGWKTQEKACMDRQMLLYQSLVVYI